MHRHDRRARPWTAQRLPLDFAFDGLVKNGTVFGTETITRNVKIWVYDPRGGTLTAAPAVSVDPRAGAEVTVTVWN